MFPSIKEGGTLKYLFELFDSQYMNKICILNLFHLRSSNLKTKFKKETFYIPKFGLQKSLTNKKLPGKGGGSKIPFPRKI